MRSKKLENYIIAVLFIGLVLLIAWKFDIVGILSERKEMEVMKAAIEANIEAWTKNAKENLKEDFVFMEGENHFFVKGKLISECAELDPNSHCPVSLREAKANSNSLFTDGSNFATPTLDIYPYPITDGISILGFLDKDYGKSISLEFQIIDYVPNEKLCKNPHDKQILCNISWTKKVVLSEPILVESLSVKITELDYSFIDDELKIFLKGETKNSEAPNVALGVYRDFGSKKSLTRERNLEPQDNNGVYGFELNESFKISDPEAGYSILLLITKKNSFQAIEWILKSGELVDTIVYD